MSRPRPAPTIVVLGGAAAAVGSLATWASVRMDLTRVFALFPSDYRQDLTGLELGGEVGLALAVTVVVAGVLATLRPRFAQAAGWVAIIGAVGALMVALLHLARLRVVALDTIALAARGDISILRGASVSAGPGTFLVLAGAIAVMAGGVLLLTGRGLEPRPPGRHTRGATSPPV